MKSDELGKLYKYSCEPMLLWLAHKRSLRVHVEAKVGGMWPSIGLAARVVCVQVNYLLR